MGLFDVKVKDIPCLVVLSSSVVCLLYIKVIFVKVNICICICKGKYFVKVNIMFVCYMLR